MTDQLIILTAWLASGLSGLGFGLAAIRAAKRRLQGSPVAAAAPVTV